MKRSIARICGPLALIACVVCGCASRSQLAKVSQEKEQLKSLVESEKRVSEQLAEKLRTATDRAAEAERELALLSNGGKSAGTSLVNAQLRRGSTSQSLEQWSRSQPLLKYDALQRLARAQVDVTFTGDDRLTFAGHRELDKVADLLLSQGAVRYDARLCGVQPNENDTRALNRANETADYLRRRGVAADRLSVTSRISRSVVDEEGRKLGGSAGLAVEIEIVERAGFGTEAVANDPNRSSGDGWTSPAGRR